MNIYRYFLLSSGMLGFFVSIYLLLFKEDKKNIWSILFLLACSFYTFGYSMEMASTSIKEVFYWLRFEHIGIVYIDAFWLFTAITYSDKKYKNAKLLKLLILTYFTAILVICFTNETHHQFYTNITLVENNGLIFAMLERGFYYWILSISHVIFSMGGMIVFVKSVRGTSKFNKKFIFLTIFIGLMVFFTYIPYIMGISPEGIDIIAFTFANIIFIWIILVLSKELDVKAPIYRDEVFINSAVALLVLDSNLNIIDENIEAVNRFTTLVDKNIVEFSVIIEKCIINGVNKINNIEIENFIYSVNIATYSQFNNSVIAGYILNFVDITELENQKNKIQKLLIHEENIVANISHELRTPLNGIKGLAQLLEVSTNIEKNSGYIKHIIDSCSHLSNLVNSLLIEFRTENKMQKFNIREVIDSIRSIFIIEAKEKQLHFFVYVSPYIPEYFYATEKEFKQIIINFVGNAIKFTKYGGVILSLKCNESKDQNLLLEIKIEDTGVGIKEENIDRIFDNFYREEELKNEYEGMGLGLNITKKLVEKYNGEISVKSQQNIGSEFTVNLGFQSFEKKLELEQTEIQNFIVLSDIAIFNKYLEKIFVDLNQSYVIFDNFEEFSDYQDEFNNEDYLLVLDSFIALNTDFKIENINQITKNYTVVNTSYSTRVQLKNSVHISQFSELNIRKNIKKKQFNKKKDNLQIKIPKFKNIRVLVVEDNAINMEIIADLFSAMQIITMCVTSAEEAIEIIKNHRFDIAFLDMQLTGMNGLDLGKHILDNYSCIVVAITASITENIKRKAFNLGFNEFITKPFEFNDIFLLFENYFPNNKVGEDSSYSLSLKKYSKILIQSLKKDDEDMEFFIKNEDYDSLKKKIHLRKGGASQIKLTRLSLILKSMEKACFNKEINIIKNKYDELKQEIQYIETGE